MNSAARPKLAPVWEHNNDQDENQLSKKQKRDVDKLMEELNSLNLKIETIRNESNGHQVDHTNTLSLRREAKELFIEWLKNSTSHGMPNIARTKNDLMRLAWFIFYLICLTYCSITIIQSISKYIDYQTTTTIKYQRENLRDFPAVTFCNVNKFSLLNYVDYFYEKDDGSDSQLYLNWLKNITNSSQPDETSSIYKNTSMARYYYNYIQWYANAQMTNADRYITGFDLERDMFRGCFFNEQPCTTENFTKFWNNDYGWCYTFNGGESSQTILQTSQTGPNYGLKVMLSTTFNLLCKFNCSLY
jgi:hypothetical protein